MTNEQTMLRALRIIARGRVRNNHALTALEAQDEARRTLISIGQDWTMRGIAAADERLETAQQ